MFESVSNIVDHYWNQMQNQSKTEEKLFFTTTELFCMETSENISFPAATHTPE